MKLTPLCISCTLARRAAEIDHTDLDDKDKLAIYRELLDTVGLYIGPDIEVVILETMSFRRLKSVLGVDVYEKLIAGNINIAATRAKEIEELIEDKPLEEKLITALRVATLATGYNVVSVPESILAGPPSAADLPMVGTSLRIGRDDTEKIISKLRGLSEAGSPIYYLFASIFELPYDRILVKIMREDLGLSITGIARHSRYRDYVTTRDLEDMGVDEFLSEIIDMGSDSLTVTREEHENLFAQLNEASLVVIKSASQSLYFHNNPIKAPHIYMFTAHCPVVAKAFGVPRRSFNILAVGFEEGQKG